MATAALTGRSSGPANPEVKSVPRIRSVIRINRKEHELNNVG